MLTSEYKQVYNDLKNYRQQLESTLEKLNHRLLKATHIRSLFNDWLHLEQLFTKQQLNQVQPPETFIAGRHVFEQFLQQSFLDLLTDQNEQSWKLARTYLEQIYIYFETLEQSLQQTDHEDVLRYSRLEMEIEHFRQQIHQILSSSKNTQIERAELKILEESWHEVRRHYDAIMREGYCANRQFEQAKVVVAQLFNEELLNTLQENASSRELVQTFLQQLRIYLTDIKIDVQKKDSKRPFLVDFWTWSLQKLEMLSVFYIIRNILFPHFTKGNYRFIDAWLLGHTALAFIYVLIANQQWVMVGFKYGLLIYGCIRMFEILIYQLNVILVHPYNSVNYSLNSYRRMTIALIHNFIEIIFWFAGTFITLQFITDSTVPLAVYTSFTHMVSYSMELDDSKWTILAIFILQFQAAIGVFMTVLSLARFVSLFPQPASLDPKEQEANEVRHTKIMEEIYHIKNAVEQNKQDISRNRDDINQIKK